MTRSNSAFLCQTCGERHRSNFFQKRKGECASCYAKRNGGAECFFCKRKLPLAAFSVNKTGMFASGCDECYEQKKNGGKMQRRNECPECKKILPNSEFIRDDELCVDCRAKKNDGKIQCQKCEGLFSPSEFKPPAWDKECCRNRYPYCEKCYEKYKKRNTGKKREYKVSKGKICEQEGCDNPADLEFRGAWICGDCANKDVDDVDPVTISLTGNAWSHLL